MLTYVAEGLEASKRFSVSRSGPKRHKDDSFSRHLLSHSVCQHGLGTPVSQVHLTSWNSFYRGRPVFLTSILGGEKIGDRYYIATGF